MKHLAIALLIGAGLLAGCNAPSEVGARARHGRYAGVGLYPAGDMWSQIAGADRTKAPAAARLRDDQQVIVVVDTQTGELRQCGNLSGYCVAMNPWVKPLGATQKAPVPLTKHAQQLEAEQDAASTAATAAAQADTAAPAATR